MTQLVPLAQNVDNRTGRGVYYKRYWTDQWVPAPYVYPLFCEEFAAPNIGSAQFRFDFGRIKQNDVMVPGDYYPNDFRGYYLAIATDYGDTGGGSFYWAGICTDQETTNDRAIDIGGDQIYTAREIGHLFDRTPITKGHVQHSTNDPITIDYLPKFNRRLDWTPTLRGNRQEDPDTDDDELYIFEERWDDGKVWTAWNVVNYLIKKHNPTNFNISLTGQSEELKSYEDVWDLDGMTLWEALNRVINRKYGLCWSLQHSGSGTIFLNVKTTTSTDITLNDRSIYANTSPRTLNLPADWPFNHLYDPIPQRQATTSVYDVIEVRGARAKVCGTLSYPDGHLLKGWKLSLEEDYKDGAGSATDPDKNDRERAHDRYDGVYGRIVVPFNWNGKCLNASDDEVPLMISIDETGEVDLDNVGDFWMGDIRLDRSLFLEKNTDYTTDPPTKEFASDQDPEYVPIIVFLKDEDDGANHTATDEWIAVDRVSGTLQGVYSSASIRPLDNQMGFQLDVTPRHIFAGYPWAGGPTISNYQPEFGHEGLYVTAVIEHPQRIKVVEEVYDSSRGDSERRLVIDVPEAQFWYIVPGTVYDIDSNGDRVRYSGDGLLRDDRELLDFIAAAAKAWYGKTRQAVNIPIKRIDSYCDLCDMLQGVTGYSFQFPVNAPVTGIRTDFVNDMVNIETGWGSADFAPQFYGGMG